MFGSLSWSRSLPHIPHLDGVGRTSKNCLEACWKRSSHVEVFPSECILFDRFLVAGLVSRAASGVCSWAWRELVSVEAGEAGFSGVGNALK